MKKNAVLVVSAALLLIMVLVNTILAEHEHKGKPSNAEIMQKTQKLQMPFIANEGQIDKRVAFYAKTFGGMVFVTKDGDVVYSLPRVAHASSLGHDEINKGKTGYTGLTGYRGNEGRCIIHRALCTLYPYCTWNFPGYYSETSSLICHTDSPVCHSERSEESYLNNSLPEIQNPASVNSIFPNPKSAIQNLKSGVALKEEFIGAKVSGIKGEGDSVTRVSYFRGNDPSRWRTNIATYDVVNLGEIYKGIELKLKAHGNNVEKLLYVKPGAVPEQIKISLSGLKPFECNGKQPPASPLINQGDFADIPLNKGGEGVVFLGNEKRIPETSPLIKGIQGLSVNEHGELVAETELGPVKYTKPVAYQMIDGKRVEIECGYVISDCGIQETSDVGWVKRSSPNKNGLNGLNLRNGLDGFASLNPSYPCQLLTFNSQLTTSNSQPAYGFKVASYDRTKDLIIDPLLASTYLGGSGGDYGYSLALDTSGNVYVAGSTYSSDFPTTTGAYNTSNNGGDVFVSKLDGGLKSLLASTYLGGSGGDYGYSLTIDTSGNVYVTGWTHSSDFPTTSGAYDTSNGGSDDVFVSKLDDGLTGLLASTYLGGYSIDYGYSLTLDTSGNVYVTGKTASSDFPTTSGACDTSFNGNDDVFVSMLDGGLTTLLASTYLGGSYDEWGTSLALDTSGNIYVAGNTPSSDFPTMSGAYDTSFNGGSDVFVSKLDGGLTTLLASTYLGGSIGEYGQSLALDTSGNVYVMGITSSTNFPITTGAYDTSFNNGYYSDAFVSKFNSGLTNLLASTYLGGTGQDCGYSLTLHTSGNVYVVGWTTSTDFPTTSGAYDTSKNGVYAVFVSKLNSGLTSLLASTYLGGSVQDEGLSLTLDTSGNVYVTGCTYSTDFPTTSGAYDTSINGGYNDVFVSKLDGNLSASAATTPTPSPTPSPNPLITTVTATNITSSSATLNGTVNANGLTTTAWFEYGKSSGSYSSKSSTQSISGTSSTPISIGISGLSAGTKYYYKIVAENSAGTSYGNEMSFKTSSTTSVQPPPFGLTIITHGYQSGTDESGWVDEMARAIASKFGGITKIPIYTMKIYTDFSASMTLDKDVPRGLDFRTAGGAIIRVDWSDLAGGVPLVCDNFTPTWKVADAIFENILYSWFRVPIHLIGHSRGASVNTELAYDLGVDGIWVDHFTSLDPQPITHCGDVPIEIYDNILFADNDYRNEGILPWGEPVKGTYQRSLNGIVTGDGEYCYETAAPELPNGSAHSQVHTYYHGTISHINDDGQIWYDDCVENIQVQPKWYAPYSLVRLTGYYFSRIEMGNRYSYKGQFGSPINGLHYRLSGLDNNRIPLKVLHKAWPNVTFKPFANESYYNVQVGSKVVFTYYYQDADSNLDITFALDDDTNPFNNSNNNYYKEIGSHSGKTKRGTISAKTTFSWVPIDADIGTHYVQIKATDADGNVRYDYLLKPINVKTAKVCKATDIKASPKTLMLKMEESDDVTVTVKGSEGCPVVGETVTATILKSGAKYISISPQSADTDTNGQAVFTITATNKTGDARVRFEAASVETTVKIRVVK